MNAFFEVEIGHRIEITHTSESSTNVFILETHKKGLNLVKAGSGAHQSKKNEP